MWSNPIFKSAANAAEYAIRPNMVAYAVYGPTPESHLPAHTRRIGYGKGLADRTPLSPASKQNAAEPTERVGCQVNTRPEIIQRQSQHYVRVDQTRRHTSSAT